ncbi:MAG: OmpA family protein [Vicinamibacterales bacterium]
MSKTLFNASLLALIVAVAPACATKGFVRTEVGNVNSKVDTLSGTVEETQERTRTNEGRIGAVDTKAEAAAKAAADARSAAEAASNEARTVETKLSGRLDTAESAFRKLVYEVTLSEDAGNFRFGQTDLPDEARSALDQMVNQLKANPNAIWIEIEGHTDNVGDQTTNERIGMERAEAVKRYLYTQHQIPLHKINVISYGE